MTQEQQSLAWLSALLDTLRNECPWDKAQTVESLRYLTIEEVYELSEAILARNPEEQRKELGDLFMHILFYSKIAADNGDFTLVDVIDGICRKLISRHPHLSLPDREGVRQPAVTDEVPRWEQVKMKEGRKSVLEGVPASLPPLVKAVRMLQKIAGAGTLPPQLASPASTVTLTEETTPQDFGQMLLGLISWANQHGINADDALSEAVRKLQHDYQAQENFL